MEEGEWDEMEVWMNHPNGFALDRKVLEMWKDVLGKEDPPGEAYLNILKQLVKMYAKARYVNEMVTTYEEMLTHITSSDMTSMENCINETMGYVSEEAAKDPELKDTRVLEEFYERALRAAKDAGYKRLWFEANMNLYRLWLGTKDYITKAIEACLKEHDKSCVQIQDAKKVYDFNPQALFSDQIGTLFERDGKWYMNDHRWDEAATAFIGAFKCYEESTVTSRKIQCLNYLALAAMEINSSVDLLDWDSDGFKPYREETLAIRNLISSYQRGDMYKFQEHRACLMDDPFMRSYVKKMEENMKKRRIPTKVSKSRVKIAQRAISFKPDDLLNAVRYAMNTLEMTKRSRKYIRRGSDSALLKNAWTEMVRGLTTVDRARCVLKILREAKGYASAKRMPLGVAQLASAMNNVLGMRVKALPLEDLNQLDCKSRVELWLVGAHRHFQAGIERRDGLATTVVDSGKYRNLSKGENASWMIYSGAGGNNKIADTSWHEDQLKSHSGNAALLKSMETGSPVHVIQRGERQCFSYIGAFYVRAVWLVNITWKNAVTEVLNFFFEKRLDQVYYNLSEVDPVNSSFGFKFNEWREGKEARKFAHRVES